MYGHLHDIEAGRKTPIYSLLNYLFLKTLQMPYFSVLNPQIFGTH